MKSRSTCFTLFAACCIAMASSIAFGQLAPVAIQSLIFDPSSPQEYESVKVEVTFSKPYCGSADAPLFSKVQLEGSKLLLLLSQLGDGPCTTRRVFKIPGLPAGAYAATVGVTGPYWANPPSGAREAVSVEQGTYPLTVNAVGNKQALYTWIYPMDPPSASGVYLVPGIPGLPIQGGNVSLISRIDEPEMLVWLKKIGPVPSAAVPLYWLDYPKPLAGAFRTTSLVDANRLRGEGFTLKTDSLEDHVLPVVNGACPMGSVPVYRVFNPKAIAHRYLSSFDTYNALAANGFVGEGLVFCTPPK